MPKLAPGSLLPLKVLVERYGLDGRPPRTVSETARRYGLTPREVRSVEGHVLRTLRRAVGA